MNDNSDGNTHAEGCHTWGPRHYECALRRLAALEQAIDDSKNSWFKTQSDVTTWINKRAFEIMWSKP